MDRSWDDNDFAVNINISDLMNESDYIADVSHDESFGSVNSIAAEPQPKSSSTPQKNNNEGSTLRIPTTKPPATFKVPAPPPANSCHVCKKTLKTERGFNKHINCHKCKEAAKLKPDLTALKTFLIKESRTIITKLIKASQNKEVVDVLQRCAELVDNQDNNFQQFYSVLTSVVLSCRHCIMMPSALREQLQRNMSKLLSCDDFRKSIINKCPVSCDPQILWFVVFDLLTEMIDSVLIFVCKNIRGKDETKAVRMSKDDFNHYLTHQVLLYIVGATLRKQVRCALQYPNNKRLQKLKDCILAKFASFGSPSVVDSRSQSLL